jgi:hypothetical protein
VIISDLERHKIDVTFNEDNFLIVTVFHAKSKTEWVMKTFGLSPEVQDKLVEVIAQHKQELWNKARNK